MKIIGFQALYPFRGWKISEVNIDTERTDVYLKRDQRFTLLCQHCQKRLTKSRSVERTALDIPLGSCRVVYIHYKSIQGRCRPCEKYTTIVPAEIGSGSRTTWRFKVFVSKMCRFMPASRVSEFVPISTPTAIKYDKEVLSHLLPAPNYDNIKILLVDEKSVRRHHNYVTVVMNGESGELLHMVEGKKKTSFESFFENLNAEQKASIEAVGMDRGGSYQSVVREQLPHADIVWDKFHVVANYNDAITDIRRSAWKDASEENKAVIKGQRFNLLRLWENQSDKQKVALTDLLNINEDLHVAYILSEALRKMWGYTYRKNAEKYMDMWIKWAHESGVKQLISFAEKISKARDGILNYCKYKITTGRLEGFNNLISRVIHRSCGIKDLKYLFMKMRQQSLGYLSA